ncbi:MAG: hypothetical protein ACYC1L_19415 [Alphaproteobacteria bacterium]
MAPGCSFQWVVPLVAALFGALVGGGISFFTARHMAHYSERRVAASKLRAAFTLERYEIKFAKDGSSIERLLQAAFPKHAQAVEEFRFFVKRKDQAAYEVAWRAYYEVGGSVRFFDYYMEKEGRE